METYEENVDDVILTYRTTSKSPEWIVVPTWHWRPIPGNTNFQPLITFDEFPKELSAEQLKAMLKVYNSCVQPKDWLPVLLNAHTPIHVDDLVPSSTNRQYRRQ